jgi:hypothetical protein
MLLNKSNVMKTLRNHQILFDAECPMCNLYTSAFVKIGMLESHGRLAYQDLPREACPLLDRQRAADEIALVNLNTGRVTYGIESLFKVLATSLPFLSPLFGFKPFAWCMSKLYALVSYNRRVIIPVTLSTDSFVVQPTFKLHYRILYLFITWSLTALILSNYAIILNPIIPKGNLYREYIICGGQIIFQGFIISLIAKDKRWEYLGNMMTISFAGGLLLLPLLILSKFVLLPPFLCSFWFLAVAGLMFLEHIRRCSLLKIGWKLTASWTMYRLGVLIIILFA